MLSPKEGVQLSMLNVKYTKITRAECFRGGKKRFFKLVKGIFLEESQRFIFLEISNFTPQSNLV
jgi:hypothetical protein